MRRAAKRNAINRAMADALDEALNELDDDDELWAGVLTGTADLFSAGSDLTAGGDYVTGRGGEYGLIRRARRKPLIAAGRGAGARGRPRDWCWRATSWWRRTRHASGCPRCPSGSCRRAPGCSGPAGPALERGPALILTGRRSRRRGPTRWASSTCSPSRGTRWRGAVPGQVLCDNSPVSVQSCLAAVNAWVGADDALGWEQTERALATAAVGRCPRRRQCLPGEAAARVDRPLSERRTRRPAAAR